MPGNPTTTPRGILDASARHRPVVVLHTSHYGSAGGTSAVVQRVMEGPLQNEFEFKVVSQNRPARGINVRLIGELAREMRHHRPQIIHLSGLQNEGFHGIMAALRVPRARILVGVHGFAEDGMELPWWRKVILSQILEPYTLRKAHAVYCVCEHGARRRQVMRFARNHLGCIYNGTVIQPVLAPNRALRRSFGFADQDIVALCVCRLSIDKGLLVLADALRGLREARVLQPKVLLVGDGPDARRITSALGPLLNEGRVVPAGFRRDIPALHALSDFFVLPTYHENLSMAILEAMSAGKAVVTTAVGGNGELVAEGKSGWLVRPGDAPALADRMRRLAQHPELAASMGALGRKRVQACFSIQTLSHRLRTVYASLHADVPASRAALNG